MARVDRGRRDQDGSLGQDLEGVERPGHPVDVRRPVGLLGPRPRGEGHDDETRTYAGQVGRLAGEVDGPADERGRDEGGVAAQGQDVVAEIRQPQADGSTEVAAADEEDVRVHGCNVAVATQTIMPRTHRGIQKRAWTSIVGSS